MDISTQHLIEQIHQAGRRVVIAVTGGGASAAGALLGVPGGSTSILEVSVPYDESALVEFLGRQPEHFCSIETASTMAKRCLERARWLASEAVAGIGCTASLVSDRPKRGEHRVHICAIDSDLRLSFSLTLTKGARDRAGEEAVVSIMLLNALAAATGISERLALPLLEGEQVETLSEKLDDPLVSLLRGERSAVHVGIDGKIGDGSKPALLLPGAFNPIHEGHWRLAEVATRLTGAAAAFELSVVNVDKPPLPLEELRRRLTQFTWKAPLWLTRAPTFIEKARLYPGATFVVGCDTAERLVMPRYYDNSAARMAAALTELRELGSRFLVAGRVDAQGNFCCLEHLTIPETLRDLFVGIAEGEFHVDISSTQLRGGS